MEISNKKFNLRLMTNHFSNSLNLVHNELDVELSEYLDAFVHVKLLLDLLGAAFSFVGREIVLKLETLHQMRLKDEFPATFESILEYEIERKMINLKRKDVSSGARNILRLHRSLEFIIHYFEALAELTPDEATSQAAADSYQATLAKHNSWVVRNAASLAMKTLPTKGQLTEKMGLTEDSVDGSLIKSAEIMNEVLKRTHSLYDRRNLLEIP